MALIIGYNSFRLKTFTPQELEIPKLESETYDYTIERRQRYFHLMRIPFFPIGKFWAVRKADGRLYEPDYHIANLLDVLEIRLLAPWYSFLGIILAFLVILGGISWGYYDQWQRQDIRKKAVEHRGNTMNEKIALLNPDDYLEFYRMGGRTYFKVRENEGELLTLDGPVLLGHGHTLLDVYDGFSQNSGKPVTTTLAKLSGTVEQVQNPPFRGGILFDGDQNLYRLMEIHRIDGPILETNGGRVSQGEIEINLENTGLSGNIERLQSLAGNVTWNTGLPGKTEHGEKFTVCGTHPGNPEYELEIVVENIHGQESSFLIKGKGHRPEITRLRD